MSDNNRGGKAEKTVLEKWFPKIEKALEGSKNWKFLLGFKQKNRNCVDII